MEREEKIENALKHFGITDGGAFTVAENNERARESFGLNTVAEVRSTEKGKFRITTYYDSECPLIIRTVSKVEQPERSKRWKKSLKNGYQSLCQKIVQISAFHLNEKSQKCR